MEKFARGTENAIQMVLVNVQAHTMDQIVQHHARWLRLPKLLAQQEERFIIMINR